MKADEVVAGSALLTDVLDWRPAEPRSVPSSGAVYELSVTPPHTYFAGGLLSHNKTGPKRIGGENQPWRGAFWRRSARTR